mmetsp:Transcript_91795/g.134171  ORF Transcript_91795/g.134171 Transcript_91795/m.134171 type:complete len:173 (+) Transcript_91795:68-586(+)
MQNFFSTVAARVLETAEKLVADENDSAVSEVELQPAEIEFAEGLSIETFSAFPVDKLDSCWIMVPAQESHAKAMLKCSPTMRQMRFALCPSRLRDEDFWQIYFIVTQKDGVEAGDDAGLSLGSSWGMLSQGLSQDDSHTPLSQDDHHTVSGSEAVLLPRNDSYFNVSDASDA